MPQRVIARTVLIVAFAAGVSVARADEADPATGPTKQERYAAAVAKAVDYWSQAERQGIVADWNPAGPGLPGGPSFRILVEASEDRLVLYSAEGSELDFAVWFEKTRCIVADGNTRMARTVEGIDPSGREPPIDLLLFRLLTVASAPRSLQQVAPEGSNSLDPEEEKTLGEAIYPDSPAGQFGGWRILPAVLRTTHGDGWSSYEWRDFGYTMFRLIQLAVPRESLEARRAAYEWVDFTD